MRSGIRSAAFLLSSYASLGVFPLDAQDRAAGMQIAFARARHLQHGINASEWFAQSANDYSAARTNRYTTRRTLR